MTTVYKLTNQQWQTYGGYQWAPDEWHQTDGSGELCGPGWLHGYDHPLLAVWLNSLGADICDPLLWEGEAEGQRKDDHGLKCGYTRMRVLRTLPLPVITMEQQGRAAIACALSVYPDPQFRRWAMGWLSGNDCTYAQTTPPAAAQATRAAMTAAEAVAWAPQAASRAAAMAAAEVVVWAAEAASRAAAQAAAEATQAAAWAAQAAAEAAWAAAWAAQAAAERVPFDLIAIIEWAVSDAPYEALAVRA